MDRSVEGKVVIVTGANTGIGFETARALAIQGAHLFLACRCEKKGVEAVARIQSLPECRGRVEYLPLDLGSLDSVRRAASIFLERGLPLHILVCNAGLAGAKGMTESGFELTFGVCHIGHFLLTRLLTLRLLESAPSRVVVVSSKAHRHAKGIDFEAVTRPTRSAGALKEYAQAKLANVLFASELGRSLEGTGVTTYAVHPGVVASDVWRSVPMGLRWLLRRFMISPEKGAETSIWCATSPALANETGLYYEKCRPQFLTKPATDPALARLLWQFSEAWTGN